MFLAERKHIATSKEIANCIPISRRYLLLVAAKLRDGRLAGVSNGPGGGYFLLREASEISLSDIIMLMEGGEQFVPPVDPMVAGTLHGLYALLRDCVEGMMHSLTLDVIVNGDQSTWKSIINEAILREDVLYKP